MFGTEIVRTHEELVKRGEGEMASDVRLSLDEDERRLVQRVLTPLVRRGNVKAEALSYKIDRSTIDTQNAYACILAEGNKTVTLTKQEYGVIESALEWRSNDLYEEVACSIDPENTELRTEAALTEGIWNRL